MFPESRQSLQPMLDRLVEDELSEPERKELLENIKNDPEAWKQLAVSFLEAQCWRRAMAETPRANPIAAPVTLPSKQIGLRIASVVAGLLIAFMVGWMAKPLPLMEPERGPIPAMLVESAPARPVGQIVWTGTEVLAQAGVPTQRIIVFENPDPKGEWLDTAPQLVSNYSKARLERMGCGLEARREVVPVELTDGRRLALLVDDIRLKLKGRIPNL